MHDELSEYLDALEQGDCYRVDALLKESAYEKTERVFLIGSDGSERGPFIRKRIRGDASLGDAYDRILKAQKAGRRFKYLPYIIEYSDNDEYRDVILEYVKGNTLDEIIHMHKLSNDEAVTLFSQICDAVIELHEGFAPPIIHRDIKPSNIIISQGNITLIDFGISRTYKNDAERDTQVFGTRGYAPPEQFGFGQTDVRSDVYSLGMLLYFCLTGENPDKSLIDAGFAHKNVSAHLQNVLLKATALDPNERFASVRELQGALNKTQVTPAATYTDGFWKRAPRWAGMVWNIAIFGVWLFFAVLSVILLFNPQPGMDAYPPIYWIVAYWGICIIGPAFIVAFMLDTRVLRQHIKLFRILAQKKDRRACLVIGMSIIIISFAICVAINMRMH